MTYLPLTLDQATHAELSRAIDTLKLGLSASELHGALSGYLTAGAMPHAKSWLSDLALEEIDQALAGMPQRDLFDQLFRDCTSDLEDPELSFDLLLPDDEAPMTDRALALVDWCRGFLGGLGMSGVDLKDSLSKDANEVLTDLARIASTRFDEESGGEEDEEAYTEVVEYVRVGVMLLHTEFSRPPDGSTRH